MLAPLAIAALQLFEPTAVPVEVVDVETGMLGELWAEVRPVLLATLITVAIAVLGFVANLARTLGPQAFEWLRDRVKDSGVRSALELIERAAAAGVDAIEQTSVARLKAMEPAGILDPGQRRQLFEAAMDAARAHVGPKMWAEAARKLEITPDRVTELLGTYVEAMVRRRKLGKLEVIPGELVDTAPIDVGPPSAPTTPVDVVRRG